MNTKYKQLIENDNDIHYEVKVVNGKRYVLVRDGQYAWATPLREWNRVLEMEAEGGDEWYSSFCQNLPYDSEFCKKNEAVFGHWNWA